MPIPVIAIFDIGKTNKKLLLFDEAYHLIREANTTIPEIKDEDGDACEDIEALSRFVINALDNVFGDDRITIKAINFSAYGASFVHVNETGEPVAPLYNYLKPFPDSLLKSFYDQYESEPVFSEVTASPSLGSLNSGFQLLRIKRNKPELHQKIHHSLHLPQYLSSIVTHKFFSDISSVGCHTALWNFHENHYHRWVTEEQIVHHLAPIFPSDGVINASWNGQQVVCGIGLHDSSAALIPYLKQLPDPFILISTGTWNVTLNPFDHRPLSAYELKNDCLCYLDYKGNPVKASRLFAGYHHEQQLLRLADYYHEAPDFHKRILFDASLPLQNMNADISADTMQATAPLHFAGSDLALFPTINHAYHALVNELADRQIKCIDLVNSNGNVREIYVDGGFSRNEIFMQLLAQKLPGYKIFAASLAQASALGAALAIHESWNDRLLPKKLLTLKSFYSPIKSGLMH